MADTNQNRAPERREPQSASGNRQGARPRRKRRGRPIWLTVIIRFFQVLGTLLLIGVITGCFMVCYAAVYVKTVIMPQTYLNLNDYTMNENSVIYYQEKGTGMLVELQTLKGLESREPVEYSQVPEDLINAFIAVEDKRFPTHNGVDWRRTASGLLRMFTGGNIQGGSTITQQLIKNVTERNDVTVNRKILEIFTALELENNYTKKDIIMFYLNRIWMGNGCRGVQSASKLYFGKDVWDLTLAECASLAGITNNPSLYAPYGVVDVVRYRCQNPECKLYSLTKDDVCEYCGAEDSYDNGSVWTNREFNKARQETILKLMADPEISPNGAYITEAERDAAIAQPLVFKRDIQAVADDDVDDADDGGTDKKDTSAVYSWYVEQVINEAIELLREETKMSRDLCEQRVLSGGLSIITAYDPEVQEAVDTVFNDRSNLDQVSTKTGQRLMSAITVVDNSTGYVVALGSTAEKKLNRGSIWPVTTTRQPGSSIKPLSVYGPAIDMGLITPASVVDDNPYLLNGKIWPLNVSASYRGLTTVQYAVTVSLNTVALRVVEMVTPEASYDFMVNKFGFTSMEPYFVKANGEVVSDIDRSPLSMGGLTWGVSTFEMAAAYATFPRNGEFTKAATVLEIRDANGNTIVDNKPRSEFIIKPETAYYINSMLTNVVTSGTGTGARIAGQTVAGKTGTTNNVYDYWFCGYTKYYTAAVWTGYPTGEVINYNHANPGVPLWQKVMTALHEDKENVPFDVPGTLNTYSICIDCGKRALDECALDVRGSRAQTFRLFAADAPAGFCECHKPVKICVDSPILDANGVPSGRYYLAGEFCPEESVKTVTMVNYQRELAKPGLAIGDADAMLNWYELLPEELRYCHVHTTAEPPVTPEPVASEEPTWPPVESGGPILPPVTSEEPVWPPVESYEPFIPPIWEPTPTPTPEPTQPGVDPDPFLPPDDPYVPVVDEWGNLIYP